jgi:endogenous inhibitor of DNA gyrase (YacG/DUF329 family)
MTEIQQHHIQEMYQLGYSYKRIAITLSLKEGTVKSYCIRAVKKGTLALPAPAQQTVCKQCGKDLVQTAKQKKRIFCSKACRQKWWNSHLYLVNRSSKALYQYICPTCGKQFSVYGNANRTYCSHTCYIKARYYQEGTDES